MHRSASVLFICFTLGLVAADLAPDQTVDYSLSDQTSGQTDFNNRLVEDGLASSINEKRSFPSFQCERGRFDSNPRRVFRLWDWILAICDTQTDGGGWVIIQRRTKGDVNFDRGWVDYKHGFGTPATDFWIGNEIIHMLTSEGYNEMRVDITEGPISYYVHYRNFQVGDERSNYRLTLSGYSGNLTDSLSQSKGAEFATSDRGYSRCHDRWRSGWWYTWCEQTNLNGLWGVGNGTGLVWYVTHDRFWGPLSSTEIKVRRDTQFD